jgi:hypothetical protein
VDATPEVDVVIPVHDPRRPVGRAVRSVLDGTRAAVRVTVVCHDIAPDRIAESLRPHDVSPAVRLVGHSDGVRSPAGPMNAGLVLASAPFLSVMGSDDEVAPGAIDSWLAVQRATGADIVIPLISVVESGPVATPPVRAFRSNRLEGVRDRLSYRSAPLGLIGTSRFGGLRFTEGLATGEDIAYSARLWFSGAHIALARRRPGYLVHADAGERVTTTTRSVQDELAALERLVADPALTSLAEREREALAVKLLRVNVFGAVGNRPEPVAWSGDDRLALQRIADLVVDWSPSAVQVLARADLALLTAIRSQAEPAELQRLARARRRFGTPSTLVPGRMTRAFDTQGPLALMAASWWIRRAAGRTASRG